MSAEIWKTVRKLYAAGILVYFAASSVLAISITDFSDWAAFTGRHAAYAFVWPAAAVAQIHLWCRSGLGGALPQNGVDDVGPGARRSGSDYRFVQELQSPR